MAESVDINNSNFDIRYTEEKDVDYLKRWVSTPTVLKRLPFSEGKELDNSVVGWMSFAPYRCTITATWKERPVGMAILYLMPYRKLAHHCVCQVVVDPAHQRQGVGGALIKNLKHLAKNYFHLEWIQFEVFEGNPLIELLKKMISMKRLRWTGMPRSRGAI